MASQNTNKYFHKTRVNILYVNRARLLGIVCAGITALRKICNKCVCPK